MNESPETQLLNALELFQYSYRFRHSLFVLVLHPDLPLVNILGDLKLLQSSHISVLLITKSNDELQQALEKLNKRGLPLLHLPFSCAQALSGEQQENIRAAFSSDTIPVLAFCGSEHCALQLCREGLRFAAQFGAKRLFYLTPARGLLVNGALQSHLSPADVRKILDGGGEVNLDREALTLLMQENKEQGLEIVILDGVPGSLFQEIFTHHGRGTLLTEDYPNIIRQARLSDVFEISRLLRPYIERGTILSISEDEIADNIGGFFVYAVNDALVASAQLVDYGAAACLAKFATLPRYQGRGRARQLAKHLIELAAEQGKDHVFALSVSPRMCAFWEKLGFTEVPRETLPEAWRRNYDFARPSRAFALSLPGRKGARKRRRRT